MSWIILFFAGLFVMVGALVKTGVIADVAHSAVEATGGNALLTAMLILGVSAPVSGIIDNIPFVATTRSYSTASPASKSKAASVTSCGTATMTVIVNSPPA